LQRIPGGIEGDLIIGRAGFASAAEEEEAAEKNDDELRRFKKKTHNFSRC
jgi:hypothetical protein